MRRRREIQFLGSVACGLAAGCATSGGGGGNQPDPLDEFQLGQDAAFDAKIGDITDADNRILDCLNDPLAPDSATESQTLNAIKAEFRSIESPQGTFEEFVDRIATNESTKADELCSTEVEQDVEFNATVARLTEALNREAECSGGAGFDQTGVLLEVKREYFIRLQASPPITTFADILADTAESRADSACNN